jgi:hypothetical protein
LYGYKKREIEKKLVQELPQIRNAEETAVVIVTLAEATPAKIRRMYNSWTCPNGMC